MFSTKLSSKPALNTFGCGLLLSLKTEILGISISKERNMFVAERFLSKIVEKYRDHPVSTDGGTWYLSIYPQACKFLNMDHHIHSQFEKSIVERTIQYIKDRTKCFVDDYFPCRKKKCKLKHLINWLNLLRFL